MDSKIMMIYLPISQKIVPKFFLVLRQMVH
nr:MAG TPA: hypothetical protein [Caudoviricetes sp.]